MGSLISRLDGTQQLKHTYGKLTIQTTLFGEKVRCYCQYSYPRWCSTLPPYFLTFPLLPYFLLLSIIIFFSFALNQTVHNSMSILSKHFSFVIYLIFCYKTCTGCLEQQQKYNIQLCNFLCLIIINSIGESSWSFSFLLIVPSPQTT